MLKGVVKMEGNFGKFMVYTVLLAATPETETHETFRISEVFGVRGPFSSRIYPYQWRVETNSLKYG